MREKSFALFGAQQAFEKPLPVAQLYFPSWERYEAAMRGIFERRYYTNQGPLACQLEEQLQQFLGVKHAICVANATIGLMMAAEALNLKGKVIQPAFTFMAGMSLPFALAHRTAHGDTTAKLFRHVAWRAFVLILLSNIYSNWGGSRPRPHLVFQLINVLSQMAIGYFLCFLITRMRFWREDPVKFVGEVADLVPLYAAADIFVLPTIYDPFSNACLEALASGLPVITTGSNGFSEIMEDGVHGSIVDSPANLVGLHDAIHFWSDPSRREAARSANIECASHFDISKNVAETLEILTRAAL